MADSSSAILFIIGLRRADNENWVKYAILRVHMSLCLGLCASEKQALRTFAVIFKKIEKAKPLFYRNSDGVRERTRVV